MRAQPQPSDGFAWVQTSGGPALVCRTLEPFASHFFTTRQWRLGSATNERHDQAWAEVAAAAGIDPSRLVRVQQVHGASVVVQRRDGQGRPADHGTVAGADIIVSDDPNAALAIQTADCVSLLMADRRTGAVAAAHAGWRGLAASVPRRAVEALTQEFGSRPVDLIAAIGPSIAACCYEVGVDVRDAFAGRGYERLMANWFFDGPQATAANPSFANVPERRRPDRWFFDGWAAASDQLAHAGVPEHHIHAARLCTASHPSFCSFRRDGAASGRMAAVIKAVR